MILCSTKLLSQLLTSPWVLPLVALLQNEAFKGRAEESCPRISLYAGDATGSIRMLTAGDDFYNKSIFEVRIEPNGFQNSYIHSSRKAKFCRTLLKDVPYVKLQNKL